MPFHFTLAPILRLREGLEKLELRRLQAIAAQIVQVGAEIAAIDAETEMARREILEQAAGGITGAELHAAALAELVRNDRRAALEAKRVELEQERAVQQTRYTEARRRREILENLRQRQLAAYQLEQSRREQQRIDELFLIRRASKQRSTREDSDNTSP
ncbi:MAG TPA: flagellar export protein FliJ [Verrucomicrobiae bacterium]|nr:flagellar export protein FliJ [Verrucomicrobiae bacterium]